MYTIHSVVHAHTLTGAPILGRWTSPGGYSVPLATLACTLCGRDVAAGDEGYASRIGGDSKYGYEPTHDACHAQAVAEDEAAFEPAVPSPPLVELFSRPQRIDHGDGCSHGVPVDRCPFHWPLLQVAPSL